MFSYDAEAFDSLFNFPLCFMYIYVYYKPILQVSINKHVVAKIIF